MPHPQTSASPAVTLLDGGMGRELEARGAPFRQPEWSALALMEAPQAVQDAHAAFIAAGAEVITTNAYAVVPFHIGAETFAAQGLALAGRAGRLARAAAGRAAQAGGTRPVRVAGCLPPVFGSYRPDLFRAEAAPALLAPLVEGQREHVDLWLAETLSAAAEAEAVAAALAGDRRPLWLAFTLQDDHAPAATAPARLRSGEPVLAALEAARRLGADALLFNCSQPEVMLAALQAVGPGAVAAGIRIGAYANAFDPTPSTAAANAEISPLRAELDPQAYLAFARTWVAAGAGILGGCCGIGPAHIAALRSAFGDQP